MNSRYRAPECLLTDGYYSYKMDVWSLGCVFFEVLRYAYFYISMLNCLAVSLTLQFLTLSVFNCSLHPLFPGSNEVDQIAKIHDVLGTPPHNVLQKLTKYVISQIFVQQHKNSRLSFPNRILTLPYIDGPIVCYV